MRRDPILSWPEFVNVRGVAGAVMMSAVRSLVQIADVAVGRLGSLARRLGLDPLIEVVRPGVQRLVGRRGPRLGEDLRVNALLGRLAVTHGYVVDIGACDGVDASNTLGLFERGWPGLAVEGDPGRFMALARAYRSFPAVTLSRTWVTPQTVVRLLEAHGIPRDPAVLSVDIDGYDHFVLQALLDVFRPTIVVAEVNEKIPPPLKFTVTYDPAYVWAEDHFYGQSIAKLHELAEATDYAIVELLYNNALLVPRERGLEGLSPDEAYRRGYLDKPDRLQVFPRNTEMEQIHALDLDGQIAFLNERFAPHAGRYELGV